LVGVSNLSPPEPDIFSDDRDAGSAMHSEDPRSVARRETFLPASSCLGALKGLPEIFLTEQRLISLPQAV